MTKFAWCRFSNLCVPLCVAGKPIAVIFPPIRDNVVNASLCAEQYYSAIVGTCPSTTKVPTAAATTTATASTAAPPTSSVLDTSVFNFLFVGRLAAVKCPGLIVRTLGYLLHSTYWSTVATDIGVETEVDREFHAELIGVARIFAPGTQMSFTVNIFP